MRTWTIGTGSMLHPTFDANEVLPASIEPRLREAGALLREASRRRCDVMCLPELFADPSQGTQMGKWAEPEGGPVTSWLAATARELQMAIVTTVALRQGDRMMNLGVAYDKTGQLAGRYAKVHLPCGEREVAAPGDGFPVFDLDGIKVGMQICYDLNFPEGCRILALKGAEVIIWPNMWGGMPEEHTDIIMKARAIDNLVCLVSSAYVLTGSGFFRVPKIHGRSCIIDASGTVVAEVGRRLGVATATVSLGDPRQAQDRRTLQEHRMPHLYGELVAR
ncbi:MAG: hypothetical protein A3K19_27940 [Lentisphaerae bacterium RIFOXYB12_FULL_65_16]|nr:MAG: hypothetical protein A3K18_12035 [Lentisphaerae bacterium RIFOXYA12_64_32]OGV88170.1 MAG: hypothetical protein A3K19_27940 [Lentisphaerae bacterium RIFOXYB12_FULL_65_16]